MRPGVLIDVTINRALLAAGLACVPDAGPIQVGQATVLNERGVYLWTNQWRILLAALVLETETEETKVAVYPIENKKDSTS